MESQKVLSRVLLLTIIWYGVSQATPKPTDDENPDSSSQNFPRNDQESHLSSNIDPVSENTNQSLKEQPAVCCKLSCEEIRKFQQELEERNDTEKNKQPVMNEKKDSTKKPEDGSNENAKIGCFGKLYDKLFGPNGVIIKDLCTTTGKTIETIKKERKNAKNACKCKNNICKRTSSKYPNPPPQPYHHSSTYHSSYHNTGITQPAYPYPYAYYYGSGDSNNSCCCCGDDSCNKPSCCSDDSCNKPCCCSDNSCNLSCCCSDNSCNLFCCCSDDSCNDLCCSAEECIKCCCGGDGEQGLLCCLLLGLCTAQCPSP